MRKHAAAQDAQQRSATLSGMSFAAGMKQPARQLNMHVPLKWIWLTCNPVPIFIPSIPTRTESCNSRSRFSGSTTGGIKKKKKPHQILVPSETHLVSQFSVKSETAVESRSHWSYEEDALELNTEQRIVIQHESCVFICDLLMALNSCLST